MLILEGLFISIYVNECFALCIIYGHRMHGVTKEVREGTRFLGNWSDRRLLSAGSQTTGFW